MANNDNIKNQVFNGLIWKFCERIAAQLVSTIVSIILARLLMPDEYGAVALVLVFIAIANVFVSHGFGNALIQKKEADQLDFSTVFYINILVGVSLYGIIYILAPYISRFYEMPILTSVLRVLAIRIIFASINSVQNAFVSRNMLFKRFFWSTLIGTIISGIFGIVLAYNGFGVWALVAQYLSNTCIGTIVLWFTVRWRPIMQCSLTRAKALFAFGWKILVSGLLETGYNQIRNLLIGKIYTSTDLAYYNQGDKYPSLIVTNVNNSISSVLFPAISKYQNDKNQVKNMTRRSIQLSSFIMWPLMIGLAVISEPLVLLLLTEKWLPCVPFLRIFCICYGLYPIHTSNLQAINAMGRSDLFLKLEIIKKVIGIGLLVISIPYGPIAIALSLLLSGVISSFINSAPNKRLLNYSYLEQLKDLMPSLILSIIMGVIVYFISYFKLSTLILIIIQVFVGGIVYLVLALLTKQNSLLYLWGIIKGKVGNGTKNEKI